MLAVPSAGEMKGRILGQSVSRACAALGAAAAFVGLAACHGAAQREGGAPVGQVIAVVDGQEITVRNLEAELGGLAPADPKARAAAQQAALQAIVSRIILADAARAQGLDKTPEFALRKQAAIDALLAQSLASKIARLASWLEPRSSQLTIATRAPAPRPSRSTSEPSTAALG